MAPSPTDLPDDIGLLKQMIIELCEQHAEELAKQVRLVEQTQNQVARLLRRIYGRQTEQANSDQMSLAFDEACRDGLLPKPAESESPSLRKQPQRRQRRRGHGRRKLPPSLPRERVEHPVANEDLPCPQCDRKRSKISERSSEQLEFIPASLVVREHVEHVHACKHCEGNVISGKKPPQPIPKGLAGPGLLAQVLTSKFADHLPLYRQQQIFSRHGVDLDRSTLCGWVRGSADLLAPIVDTMKAKVLSSSKIHTDDTSVAVMDKSLGATRRGRLWVYIGGADHEHTVFDYTQTRERAGPQRFLKGFSGFMQADAYPAYDQIYADMSICEVACWAHARRKFFEASRATSSDSFTALVFVRQLYQIENKAKDFSTDQRCVYRQKHAVPVLDAFKSWLDAREGLLRPKSLLGDAIGYVLRQWAALRRYTEDGHLEIDNNRAERALRSVAIGRKNWMFLGNDDSGKRTAIIYSLIVSCKSLGIDPFAYLRDVLETLPSHPAQRIEELTPKAWLDARLAETIAA